jgi:hypothetical protein
MANPLFTVDRRPCVHLAQTISQVTDSTWSSNPDFCEAIIDDATGNRLPGYDQTTNKGVQVMINTMQYHYDRGIRRFIINTPCGTLENGQASVAYSGIWSPMQQRKIAKSDGTFVVNPYKGCWKANGYNVPDLASVDSAPFISVGKTAEYFQLLRSWLTGGMGWTGNKLGQDPVEIYIYTSHVIPLTSSGQPDYTKNWVRYPGNTVNVTWQNQPNGFAMPDPESVAAHQSYLQSEMRKWYEIGVCGFGADVGLFAWNHRKGDWIYTNNPAKPANYDSPVTNMRRWFERDYFALPVGQAPNQRFNPTTKFTYFQEIHPWDQDPNKITNRTTSNSFPTANTNEAYSFYDPWGSNGDSNSTAYKGSWQHYSPYIIGLTNMNTWINGNWENPTNQYNGADPNRKWEFDKTNTEIHLLVTQLARPYTDTSNTLLTQLSNNINDPATQTIINDCANWYMDYFDRGYVYQPVLYHNSYQVEKEIHKKIMQNLGYWPQSNPAA